MSKKLEVGGFSEKGRMVDITSSHILWIAQQIDGELVVEKYIPGIKSEHSLYIECSSEDCKKYHINKVFIPQDVEYFMSERHKVSEVFSKCNTFSHLSAKRQICVEFAKLIVKSEDPIAYEDLSRHSTLAEDAVRYMTERVEEAKKKDSIPKPELS